MVGTHQADELKIVILLRVRDPKAPVMIDPARDIRSLARKVSVAAMPPWVAVTSGTTRACVSNRLVAASSRRL